MESTWTRRFWRPFVTFCLGTKEISHVIPMNSVFYPVGVVAILRRLANVISTLSISNQYLLHTRAQPDENQSPSHSTSASNIDSEPSNQLDSQRSSLVQPHSPPPPIPRKVEDVDIIHQLLRNPTLYDPIRKPRYPIVLCHGTMPLHIRTPFVKPHLIKVYTGSMYAVHLLFPP